MLIPSLATSPFSSKNRWLSGTSFPYSCWFTCLLFGVHSRHQWHSYSHSRNCNFYFRRHKYRRPRQGDGEPLGHTIILQSHSILCLCLRRRSCCYTPAINRLRQVRLHEGDLCYSWWYLRFIHCLCWVLQLCLGFYGGYAPYNRLIALAVKHHLHPQISLHCQPVLYLPIANVPSSELARRLHLRKIN